MTTKNGARNGLEIPQEADVNVDVKALQQQLADAKQQVQFWKLKYVELQVHSSQIVAALTRDTVADEIHRRSDLQQLLAQQGRAQ
jgi:hypothetical protein